MAHTIMKVLVKDGEILDTVVGALDRSRLSANVEWLLSKARRERLWDRQLGPAPAASPPAGAHPAEPPEAP